MTAFDMTASQLGAGEGPFLSPRRVAGLLGVTLSELAALIGVPATRSQPGPVRARSMLLSALSSVSSRWHPRWLAAKIAPQSGSSTSRSRAGPARPPMIGSARARPRRCLPIWRRPAPASMPYDDRPPLVLWRAHVPRWAHLPLSGKGGCPVRRALESRWHFSDLCRAGAFDRLGGVQSGFRAAPGSHREAGASRRQDRRPDGRGVTGAARNIRRHPQM